MRKSNNLLATLELVDQSKVYPSHGNLNEVRVYLNFKKKEGTEPLPRPADVVKGSN